MIAVVVVIVDVGRWACRDMVMIIQILRRVVGLGDVTEASGAKPLEEAS